MERPTTDAGSRPTSPPPDRPAPRQLRRRPDEGHIAGVCAGVADYFNVDPVIVRIAAVVLLFTGSGAIAYILAWIFVPEADPTDPNAHQGPIDPKDRRTQIFGIALMALALSVIWGDWWSPGRRWFVPFGLIALGAWLLLRRDRDADEPLAPPPPVPPSAAPAWAPPTPSVFSPVAASEDPPTGGDPTATDTTTVLADPLGPEADAAPAAVPSIDGGDASEPPTWPGGPGETVPPVPPAPTPPEPPAATRRRRLLGPLVFGALLIWGGLAWLFGVSVQNALAVGLCLLGVGFVLGAFVGGSRALILPALLVGAALAVTALIDIPLAGPVGRQAWAPVRVEDVQAQYEVSVGEGRLDLSRIDVPAGDRLPVEASVGVGHLVVVVPADTALDITTSVGGGESMVLGVPQHGVGVNTQQFVEDGATGGTLVLDLQVGVGQIEVIRDDGPRPSLSGPS